MCVIGHRSGFIEGAGLIGIPIFYLNNERTKIYLMDEQGEDKGIKPGPGDLLWRTPKNPDGDRLRELASVMDTFIPIEALERGSETEIKPTNSVLRVEEAYKEELAAALFMFMCCDIVQRLSETLLAALQLRRGEKPGWVARVDMIHHECEGHEPGPTGCKDAEHLESNLDVSQTGQEWLRRRYLFATSDKEVPLLPWTGILTGKWLSETVVDSPDSVRGNAEHYFGDAHPPAPSTSSRLQLDFEAIERVQLYLEAVEDALLQWSLDSTQL
jgi:hypothetical protein